MPTTCSTGRQHADRELLEVTTRLAADAVETIVTDGVAAAMNRFNSKAQR